MYLLHYLVQDSTEALIQARKTGKCPVMTEKNVDWDVKHQQ